MTSLVFFIENIALGLYILSSGGILFMLYRLQRARRELAISQFKLEREHALVRRASAITFGGLLIELMIGVWAVANLTAPTLRDIRIGENENNRVAGAPTKFATHELVPGAPLSLDTGGAVQEEQEIFATPEPTATPVGTIIPDAPAATGCSRDSAWFLIPANGQLIFETTSIIGTANIGNFAFYKFEVKSATIPGAEFATLGSGNITEPVVEGPLGEIVPLNFAPDEYRFRITVFDNTGWMAATCEVTIHISEPPVTPTPTSTGEPGAEGEPSATPPPP